jgi:hypothetical protein
MAEGDSTWGDPHAVDGGRRFGVGRRCAVLPRAPSTAWGGWL